MTRLFYPASRAHHAYSMTVDFGMEFERRFGKWEPEGLLHLSNKDYRIYVHPDSGWLLKPQVGDVCQFKPHRFCHITEEKHERKIGGRDYTVVRLGDFYEEYSYFERIIQRQGLPFHWPEQES